MYRAGMITQRIRMKSKKEVSVHGRLINWLQLTV